MPRRSGPPQEPRAWGAKCRGRWIAVACVLWPLALCCLACELPPTEPGDAPADDDWRHPDEPYVEFVTVAPDRYNLLVGDTVRYKAAAWAVESCFFGCTYRRVHVAFAWSSSDSGVAMVEDGLVTAVTPGVATITAATAHRHDSAQVTVAENFQSLEAVAAAGWTTLTFPATQPYTVGGTCALDAQGAAYCWGGYLNDRVPVPVASALTFTALTVGVAGVCGLTPGGAAYCWGGALLVGSPASSETPVRVGSGEFQAISASIGRNRDDWDWSILGGGAPIAFACAVMHAGEAYCWGGNDRGQLGSDAAPEVCALWGDDIPCSRVPIPVAGGLRFANVDAGSGFACGLTPEGRAYCWGDNTWGQLGSGDTLSVSAPVAVAGDLVFQSISAGAVHTCGLTAAAETYCWGRNELGQLGVGSADSSAHPTPEPVVDAPPLDALEAGGFTCGLTPSGAAYCWGVPWEESWAPHPVPGGFTFGSLAVGLTHACGVPPAGRVEPGRRPLGTAPRRGSRRTLETTHPRRA